MTKISGRANAIAYFEENGIVPTKTARTAVHIATINLLLREGLLQNNVYEEEDHYVFSQTFINKEPFIPDDPESRDFLLKVRQLDLQCGQLELERTKAQTEAEVALASLKAQTQAIIINGENERLRIENEGRIKIEEIFSEADERRLRAQADSQQLFVQLFAGTVQALAGVATASIPLLVQGRD